MSGKTRNSQDSDLTFTKEEKTALTLLSLFVASIILTGILIAAIMKEMEEEDTEEPDLEVVDMLTQPLTPKDNNSYEFDLLVLITNRAETPATNVRIEIAGIDNSAKLTYDKTSKNAFDIQEKTTEEVVIHLVVPKVQAHKMYVMVFVDDVLKIKGYSIVSEEGNPVKQDFRVTYRRSGNDDDDDNDGNIARAIAYLVFVFIPLLLMEGFLFFAHLKKDVLIPGLKKCFARVERKRKGSIRKRKGRV